MNSKVQDFFNKTFFDHALKNSLCLAESGLKNQKIGVQIEGSGGGQWLIVFDAVGAVKITVDGGENENIPTLIQTSEKIFEGLLTGSVNIPMAFLTRKLKVKGETNVAVKLGLALKKVFLT